jgi:hypothetical protein
MNKKMCPLMKVSDNEMYVWESTMSGRLNDGVKNGETGKTTFGVQLRKLRDVAVAYTANGEANVGICTLRINPCDKLSSDTALSFWTRQRDLREKINSVYKKYNGVTYDANPLSLLGSLFPALRGLRNITDDILGKFSDANKWLFCSEFAAALYEMVGVITDETDGVKDGKMLDPRNVVPVDFLGIDADKKGNSLYQPIVNLPPVWFRQARNDFVL